MQGGFRTPRECAAYPKPDTAGCRCSKRYHEFASSIKPAMHPQDSRIPKILAIARRRNDNEPYPISKAYRLPVSSTLSRQFPYAHLYDWKLKQIRSSYTRRYACSPYDDQLLFTQRQKIQNSYEHRIGTPHSYSRITYQRRLGYAR